MFIPCIYIHFNQNLNEKSYISTKIDAVKHLYTVFANCGTADVKLYHREPRFILTS